MDVNHRGSVGLARLAREAGVKRFIQASSCSTYGAGGDEMRTETSELAPQTAYARCKILVEEGVRDLMADDFTPVFMRNATAYGASPRQRFDLVLNNLCGFAHTIGEIRMTSDGFCPAAGFRPYQSTSPLVLATLSGCRWRRGLSRQWG
jgi:nucleoside-diphosphate-sugar epimerase